MRRSIKPSVQFMVLSVCIAASLATFSFCLNWMTAAESVKASERTALNEGLTSQRLTTNKPATIKPSQNGYTVIAQRNLFERLIAPKVVASSTSHSFKLSQPVSLLTPPTLPVAPLPMPLLGETRNPVLDKIAVVGTMQVGNDWYALVEDVGKGDTRTVREGESAFGYVVKTVYAEGAVLEREGKTFAVAVGENKAPVPFRPQTRMVGSNDAVGALPSTNFRATPMVSAAPFDVNGVLNATNAWQQQQAFSSGRPDVDAQRIESDFAAVARAIE